MSDNVNFEMYVERERERLNDERRILSERIADSQRELAALDTEFDAIDAYEAAKRGKAQPAIRGTARRARRGSRREEIINLLSKSPNGLKRGELLVDAGVKGDKAGEMSVSNALTALQRASQVIRHDGGRWTVVAQPLQAAAE